MATPTGAPATPVPAPTRTTPPPAPVPPTALSPVTRRRSARTAPPTRVTYTRHATTGDDDDRIVANALVTFYKVMAWGGGAAILWIFVSTAHCVGANTTSATTAPTAGSVPAPAVQIVVPQPLKVEVQLPTTQAQSPVPGWQSRGFPTRDDCEYHFIVELHEAPAGRCN